MKGPSERLKYDLRRLWECPACKRRERAAGTVTFRHCGCQMKPVDGKPVVMKLVADGVQRLLPVIAIKYEQPEPIAAASVASAGALELSSNDPAEGAGGESSASIPS